MTTDRRCYKQAPAVVFHIPGLTHGRRWLLPGKRPGQLWVAWSMESARNYPLLEDPAFMRRFDLTMTYRFDSDVPVPYFSFYGSGANLARCLREPVGDKPECAPVVAFISGRVDGTGRRRYLEELARCLPVDSYGRFMPNRRLECDRGRPSKLEVLRRYRFTFAFENARDRDYVTEKFYDPLVAGSVPVYLGAPNVRDFAPGEHCFIDAADFSGPRELASYLLALSRDEAAYLAYFAWKSQPFLPEFERRVALAEIEPFERLAALVAARRTA